MKTFYTFILFLSIQITSWACSCAGVLNFCEHSKNIKDDEKGLIWIGEFIQKDSIDEYTAAYQFKVEEIIHGNIITKDSPFASGSSYENTDSTIWVLGGEGSLCLYDYQAGRSIFAIGYNSNNFGYTASICAMEYMNIPSDEMLNGHIFSNYETESISLSDLREVIDASCVSNNDHFSTRIEESLTMSPNPTADYIDLILNSNQLEGLSLEVYDILGKKLFTRGLKSRATQIDLRNYRSGIYILSFTKDRFRYSKKLIKV